MIGPSWRPLNIQHKKKQTNISGPKGVFAFSCTLYFIRTFFLVLIILHFAFCLYLTTHNTNINYFFLNSLVLFLYFIRNYSFLLIVLAVPSVLTVQHTTQTSMPPTGFEPAIPASDRPQTLALDLLATEIGSDKHVCSGIRTHRSQQLSSLWPII